MAVRLSSWGRSPNPNPVLLAYHLRHKPQAYMSLCSETLLGDERGRKSEMLVVKAEIWPGGDESRAILIGKIEAANVSDLADVSSYEVLVDQLGDKSSSVAGWKEGFQIDGHRRTEGCWALVAKILKQVAALQSRRR